MATIQMVTRLNELQGRNLASRLGREADVVCAAWWAGEDESEPRLLIGFSSYDQSGPLACIQRVSDAIDGFGVGEAPGLMETTSIASDDARIQALVWHPWTAVPLNASDLIYRYINVWSRTTGPAQALVYFLRVGDEVRVPLPPAVAQAA